MLGPRPADPTDARTWVTAATAVTAYRERYDLPDHLQLLGERPGLLRPDAQAAYDHAQLQVDLHLARPYLHLNPQQLQRLQRQLAGHLRSRPRFDLSSSATHTSPLTSHDAAPPPLPPPTATDS